MHTLLEMLVLKSALLLCRYYKAFRFPRYMPQGPYSIHRLQYKPTWFMPSFQRSVAVLPLVDNQSAFWSLHPYVYGKTFPAIPFSRATATAATERKNGNGIVETRH